MVCKYFYNSKFHSSFTFWVLLSSLVIISVKFCYRYVCVDTAANERSWSAYFVLGTPPQFQLLWLLLWQVVLRVNCLWDMCLICVSLLFLHPSHKSIFQSYSIEISNIKAVLLLYISPLSHLSTSQKQDKRGLPMGEGYALVTWMVKWYLFTNGFPSHTHRLLHSLVSI